MVNLHPFGLGHHVGDLWTGKKDTIWVGIDREKEGISNKNFKFRNPKRHVFSKQKGPKLVEMINFLSPKAPSTIWISCFP